MIEIVPADHVCTLLSENLVFLDLKFVTRNAATRNELGRCSVTRNRRPANLRALPGDRTGTLEMCPTSFSRGAQVRCNAAEGRSNLFQPNLEVGNA